MSNSHLRTARVFAKAMDNQFSLFGIGFGLDTFLGFIPFAGDLMGAALSLYLLWIGVQMKIPAEKMMQMISNVVLDTVIGILPVIGDIGDLFFKANVRNLAILEDFAKEHHLDGDIIEGEIITE